MLREQFKKLLRILAKRVIARYKPFVVGITGSVGKTTTKEAIYAVLKKTKTVRKNEENYNNEFGIPMTVLNIQPLESKSIIERLNLIDKMFGALWLAYGFPRAAYPEVLVLELGADKPGDISYLTDIVNPRIGVVTAMGDVPVHVEFYSGPEEVAREKAKLIQCLPENGLAVLNYDDESVRGMRGDAKAKVMTFGLSMKADVWASDIRYFTGEEGNRIGGLSFNVNYENMSIPSRAQGVIAPHQIYNLLAATAVGIYIGMDVVNISERFRYVDFPKGRMRLLRGINNTVIIDDTYNSSPLSAHAALESLSSLSSAYYKMDRTRRRRVAILGDMKELGDYTEEAHCAIGNKAARAADVVVGVGNAALFITEQAKAKLGNKRVTHFDTSDGLAKEIRNLIKPKDIILIKGSQAVRLERVVKAILNEPGSAEEFLVRQKGRWEAM